MLHKFFIFFVFSLICIASARASGCDSRFEFFYLYHSPEMIKNIIEETSASKNFQSKISFFTAFFATYKKAAFQSFNAAGVSLEHHDELIEALWAAGMSGAAIVYAQKAGWPIKQIMDLSQEAAPILYLPIEYDGFFTYLHDYFSVTGDTKYISKMIDILGSPHTPLLEKIKKDAEKELFSLIVLHDRVYELCLKEARSRKGLAKIALERLLEDFINSFKNHNLPEWNGILNGEILITDSPSFEEEWKNQPVDSGPIGQAISQFTYDKGNREIKIIPLFSGMALDSELNANVTFDLGIYDSQGACIAEWRDQCGVQRKIPSRFLVQAADDFILLRFFDSDETTKEDLLSFTVEPGTYKIVGTIKDQIGKKELTITRTLEILSRANP